MAASSQHYVAHPSQPLKPLDHASNTTINGHSPIEDLTVTTRDMTRALQRCARSPLNDDQRHRLATFVGTVTTSMSQLRDRLAPVPEPPPQNQRVDFEEMSLPLQVDVPDNPDDQAQCPPQHAT